MIALFPRADGTGRGAQLSGRAAVFGSMNMVSRNPVHRHLAPARCDRAGGRFRGGRA
jgi:hypothetical protein